MFTVNEVFPFLVGISFVSFLLMGLVVWFIVELESSIEKRLEEIEKKLR